MQVKIDALLRATRNLCNQCFTRYYLDIDGDGSYHTVAIDILVPDKPEQMRRLNIEMKQIGFEDFEMLEPQGPHLRRYRWRGERDSSEIKTNLL